jgi:hypothetical protein
MLRENRQRVVARRAIGNVTNPEKQHGDGATKTDQGQSSFD